MYDVVISNFYIICTPVLLLLWLPSSPTTGALDVALYCRMQTATNDGAQLFKFQIDCPRLPHHHLPPSLSL